MAERTSRSEYNRRPVNAHRSYDDNRRNSGRNEYVYGNTARALRPIDENVRTPRKVNSKSRRRADKDNGMNLGFMVFLVIAMAITGVVCIRYIRLQSDVTAYVDKISSMEIELEELRAENDDYESRIKGTVGLEEIKSRAMNDLGMTYARDEQIVVYESDGTDYVRQYITIE